MSNIEKIQKEMVAQGLFALLLSDELDRLYAAGFDTSDGKVLIFPDKAYFITDSRYIEAAKAAVCDAEVIMSSPGNRETDILRRLISENGVGQVGVQDEYLSYSEYLRLEKALEVNFVPAQKITATLRQIKERWEVDNIVAAQRIAEKALDEVLGLIKPGMTEKEVAAELEYRMAKNGAQGLAFETICVSGPNSSRPHGVPGSRKLQNGDFVTMDFGCKFCGYCSDMTRTVALGRVTDEMKTVYETVLSAQLSGIAAFKGGVIGKQVDLAARKVIEDAGYGEYFGHGFGHSVGLYIHESPNAGYREERPLPAGAVVTAEPGIYLPGKFGVRIEDMVLVTENGCEILTKAPKNLVIL
ncbi:MAG: aminopeptidase P family protein [Clostridia bacterium]|nr:aminopeptidase P family protein [Clostridia bacterium]